MNASSPGSKVPDPKSPASGALSSNKKIEMYADALVMGVARHWLAIFNFAWSRDGKKMAISQGTLSRDAILLENFDQSAGQP